MGDTRAKYGYSEADWDAAKVEMRGILIERVDEFKFVHACWSSRICRA